MEILYGYKILDDEKHVRHEFDRVSIDNMTYHIYEAPCLKDKSEDFIRKLIIDKLVDKPPAD